MRCSRGAEQLQAAIADEAAQLDLQGVRFKNPGIKKRATAEEKLTRKGIEPGELTDIARAGFEIERPELADLIVQRLAARFEILDKGLQVTGLGYSDRKLLVRTEQGTVGEVQLWAPRMIAAKTESGQDLYTHARALTRDGEVIEGNEAAYAELQTQSRRLYGDALAEESEQWIRATLNRMTAQEADELLSASPALRSSASNISPDAVGSFRSSTGDMGDQPAPGLRTTQPAIRPSGERTTTPGRPSELTVDRTSPAGRAITSPPDVSISGQHRAVELDSDLFGPVPVREQQLADARRAVDERLGAGREDIPAESRGDLFDHGRARQTDISDAQVAQIAREQGLDMPAELSRAERIELERIMRENDGILELPDRLELDVDGNEVVVHGRGVREVFEELRARGRALEAVEACTLGRRAS
jgi:hypothetical protein